MENKGKFVGLAFIWIAILGIGVLAFKWWWSPRQENLAKQEAEKKHEETIAQTSAPSRFKHTINFGIDSFSGYAILRSPTFASYLANHGIRLNLVDDQANYPERLKKLSNGGLDMAVYTLDAQQKNSAALGDIPAVVIAMIDETKGADALVASSKAFPNIDALNNQAVKIVCTPDSPSETLARVVMYSFNLDRLPRNSFQFVNGGEAVYNDYRRSKPTDMKVFALWEPYVSQITGNPEYHVLLDSSKFRGYIVDVLVVGRDFLLKNPELVQNFLKAYFSSVYELRNKMEDVILQDAKALGQPLTAEQAKRLVQTIWWKNTQENFSHFGLNSGQGLQHIEEMCANISRVLVNTGAMSSDPTNGQFNKYYYDGALRSLFDGSWHPGLDENVRSEQSLNSLSEEEWAKLRPVGTLQVPRLVFARGTDRLTPLSFKTLDDLAEQLKTWPQYYLTVRGNVSKEGDVEANRVLSQARAQSALEYLVQKGVDKNRIKADTSHPNGSSTVAFILGELPY